MKIIKKYRNTRVPVSKFKDIADYISDWDYKHREYVLHYRDSHEEAKCTSFSQVSKLIHSRGDTTSFTVDIESKAGRLTRVDTTDPTRIAVEVDNVDETLSFLERVEKTLGLQPLPRRIFITHGKGETWLQVQRFVEKETHLNLEVVELAEEPHLGRAISQKLDQTAPKCSYALIVMTGDDVVGEDEVRARENVMHEIGFFQGRYGFDRVCLLREDGVNIPSNVRGLGYHGFPKGLIKATFADLQRELREAFPP